MTTPIYTVYKTTNLINNKIYIGIHKTNNLNDSYLGSGNLIQSAIKKYGKSNFSKKILFEYDNPDDMILKEIELVDRCFVNNTNTYNLMVGGNGISKHTDNKKWSDKRKLAKSIQMKGNIPWNKDKLMNTDFCDKISKSMVGTKRALGTKRNKIQKLYNALNSTGGIIIDPFNNKYPSFNIAIKCGCPNSIRKHINSSKKITQNQYNRTQYLNSKFSTDIIGKTFSTIGFKILPLNDLSDKELKQMAKYYI